MKLINLKDQVSNNSLGENKKDDTDERLDEVEYEIYVADWYWTVGRLRGTHALIETWIVGNAKN